jgi:putative transposase
MQAVSKENGHVVLPMGRGRKSLVLPLDLPETSRSCTLVWNNGYELHVCVEIEQREEAPGNVHATVDLGEIHLAAVTTNTGKAMIVTGRGIRTLKRQRTMQLRSITKKQSRCSKYSRRWKKLQHAKNRQWNCKVCGFSGHRDLVGSVNMHKLAFGEQVEFPRSFTYLRPSSL